MFYSHQLLARKTPIGTVWSAAHLQNRLKKSDYTSTNIPSTVEKIMYPEVPIALRMSSHLLLGVVRIYSKQVDYLYKDCYGVLTGIRKAFSSVNINLPQDATQASYYSVTLPERFELDAFEDDNVSDRHEDTHLKLPEEITLEDQFPTGYVVITLEPENHSPFPRDTPDTMLQPMAEDIRPPVKDDTIPTNGDPSSSNHPEFNAKPTEHSTPEIPDIENRLSVPHNPGEDVSLLSYNIIEPDQDLMEQIIIDDKIKTPVSAETLLSDTPHSLQQKPPSISLQKSRESLDIRIGSKRATPELLLQQSPPVEQQRRKQTKRRRLFFDESTVLTNMSMKAALEDPRGILRRKRNCPGSNMDIWKLNKRLKKDSMFLEPLITGLCSDLRSMYEREVISSKPHLRKSEEPHPEPVVLEQSPTPTRLSEVEIELPRNIETPRDNHTYGFIPSPSPVPPTPTTKSPQFGSDFTPLQKEIGSEKERSEATIRTDTLLTPPSIQGPTSDKRREAENSIHSNIPEMDYSVGELSFLEQDDNTPAGSQGTPDSSRLTRKDTGTQEYDQLSARTRAVAQYLKRQSSITPNSAELQSLSLNKILEGKSRKVCARMFNEMLVLKNCGLVDVNQETPFQDITLKVTSKLLKG
ncbi:OLC1v1001627C1 [Oldenlandia corymbosa var. corymbosa]|uniref:OLC1v1001627C1 n=1 Tax=Oldenlandia corymbosa var. corymbosa TaxID=529605 RepID=A0AAV1D5M0_OLDCO|nr:OLC1v1001627C1 [Oldenlandia corymbosa var. corymbosa]